MFKHCKVANDESSGTEDDAIDASEFFPSVKDGIPPGATKTPEKNMPSIFLLQVNISSLYSSATD